MKHSAKSCCIVASMIGASMQIAQSEKISNEMVEMTQSKIPLKVRPLLTTHHQRKALSDSYESLDSNQGSLCIIKQILVKYANCLIETINTFIPPCTQMRIPTFSSEAVVNEQQQVPEVKRKISKAQGSVQRIPLSQADRNVCKAKDDAGEFNVQGMTDWHWTNTFNNGAANTWTTLKAFTSEGNANAKRNLIRKAKAVASISSWTKDDVYVWQCRDALCERQKQFGGQSYTGQCTWNTF